METVINTADTSAFFQIRRVLQYFAIFNFPLTSEEIFYFLPDNIGKADCKKALTGMEAAGAIIHFNNYFYIPTCSADCVQKRNEYAQQAKKLLPKARLAGRLIALFPFVRFVGISGSLSKGHAKPGTDFDFFIITAANTLWICRSILHLFKKITFLFGGQHWFCMNYFIDEHHLVLEERNMFTQIELATLIPLNNFNLYKYFLLKNDLPNVAKLDMKVPDKYFVKMFEKLRVGSNNSWWQSLNLMLMRLTDAKWKKKWKKKSFPDEEYELCFKTTAYVSKNHPKNYQKRVLEIIEKT